MFGGNTMSEFSLPGHDKEVPVLIVGGSVVGLSMALFLAQHGVHALLVERHATTSIHARAGGFNARTMELFRQVSLEAAIFQQETPPEQRGEMGLRVESLAGKVLDQTEAWAHRAASISEPFASPTRTALIGQDKLEPILRKQASELGCDIRFGTELVHFEPQAEGVNALLREQATGEGYCIHARYLVAAISILDLYGSNFVLLAGSDGQCWHEMFAKAASRLGLSVDMYSIGQNQPYSNGDGSFLASYGISDSGAVLVRPDGFISWRAQNAATQLVGSDEIFIDLSRLLGYFPSLSAL
jgi:hypothetical protein